MALYMTQLAYTPQAWAALAKKPEDRGAAFGKLVEKFGGKLHNIYYCFGEYDGLIIYEAPDNETATAAIIAAVTPGHLKATKTTVLFTMQQEMKVLERAGQATYAAPTG
jgi:uncharacterized protein with GYD domain